MPQGSGDEPWNTLKQAGGVGGRAGAWEGHRWRRRACTLGLFLFYMPTVEGINA